MAVVCVVDALAGVHTPKKIGPTLRLADLVVITKGDIVSQVEREVFAYHVRLANPGARALFCNGITGQGRQRPGARTPPGASDHRAGRQPPALSDASGGVPVLRWRNRHWRNPPARQCQEMQFADLKEAAA